MLTGLRQVTDTLPVFFYAKIRTEKVIGMYVYFNPNPAGHAVGDCVVRALCKATGGSWDKTFVELAVTGFELADMPSANAVWGAYLHRLGYERTAMPDKCPECYTVRLFAEEHPAGTYILALSGHVVAVQDGNYFDAWDSGNEIPLYVWQRRADK